MPRLRAKDLFGFEGEQQEAPLFELPPLKLPLPGLPPSPQPEPIPEPPQPPPPPPPAPIVYPGWPGPPTDTPAPPAPPAPPVSLSPSFGAAPPGFDPTMWADPAHLTPKYQVGRLASQYRTDPSGFLAALKQLDPEATFDLQDIVTLPNLLKGFEGGTKVDVYSDWRNTRTPAWQLFEPITEPGSVSQALPPVSGSAPPSAPPSPPIPTIPELVEEGTQIAGPPDPGIFPPPVQPVGEDRFSNMLLGGLASVIGRGGGSLSPLGITTEQGLEELIQSKGAGDPRARMLRFEAARELIDKARRTQLTGAREALANRNTLSIPGIEQGPVRTTIQRIEESLAPVFAAAVRDIMIQESESNDIRLMGALQTAAGMSNAQAQILLSSLQEGTNRQQVLANIALQSLNQNMAWSQFLAQYGLDREEVMNTIQQGNTAQLLPLINFFLQLAGTSAKGFI